MLNALLKAWITTPINEAIDKVKVINDKFSLIDKHESRIRELQELLADLIKYPPNTQGIPLLDIDEVLLAFEPVIEETFRASGMIRGTEELSHPCFNNTYMPVIKRIVSYFHLLPASEYNHHNEVGGLISHSLEVGLMALRLAKNKKLDPLVGSFQDTEKLRESRWQFATWLCGMMHDCGKIITDISVVNLKANDVIWQPQFETLYEWSKNNSVERYQVVWNSHRVVRGHDGIAPIMITSMINGIAKRWLFDPSDDLSGPLVNALSQYANKDGYIESCIRTADHLSSERDLKIQVHKLLGKRRSGIEQRLLDAIKECRVNKWRKVNCASSRLFIIHDEVYLKYPEAIEDIAKTINHYQVNAVPTMAKALLEVLEASLIIIRNHEQSDYSILSFTDSNNNQHQQKVVRLNFTGIAFNMEIVPPSLMNCTLALSANGETVDIDNAGNLTYSEPNKQYKTAFNYDGYIHPNKQPVSQVNSPTTTTTSSSQQSAPSPSTSSTVNGANNTPSPAATPTSKPKKQGKTTVNNANNNTPSTVSSTTGNNKGTPPAAANKGLVFENDAEKKKGPKSTNSTPNNDDNDVWNNDMGFGVTSKESDDQPDSDQITNAVSALPPNDSVTATPQSAVSVPSNTSPHKNSTTDKQKKVISKTDNKQRNCMQVEENMLALLFIIAKSYHEKLLPADTVLSPKSQDGLYINIILLDGFINENLNLKNASKYVDLKNKKNDRRIKVTEDLKSIGIYWRINRQLTIALGEMLGCSLHNTRELFTPVTAMGIKLTEAPKFKPVTLTASTQTETILLKSKISTDLNWLQEGFYVQKK